jgi:SAM-dependent methyltransferase
MEACMPGHVDLLDSRQVVGWALEADRKTPDRVIIYVDGKEIAQIRPTFFRPDLRDAGLGDGWSGFRFYFPTLVGVREPTNVVVRSASSGEIHPHTVGEETFLTGRVVEAAFRSSLRQGFTRCAYAAEATGVLTQSAERSFGTSEAVLSAGKGDHLVLTARVLAPPGAILGVVPSMQCRDVIVGEVAKISQVNLPLPPNASVVVEISFDVHGSNLTERKLLTFDLLDRNPVNTVYNKCPISPVARMCFPGFNTWLSVPGQGNYIRTCGLTLPEHFIISGVTTAYQIRSIANEFLGEREDITVLDWGIGCGRIAVPLKRGFMSAAIVIGRDVDKVNVEWCKTNLPDIEVDVCDFYPPIDLESSSVDLIYGISVMTHLTEGAQLAWLKDLRRVLNPGGICILTTHGEYSMAWGTIHDQSSLSIQDPFISERLGTLGISDAIIDRGPLGESLMSHYYRGTYQTRGQVEDTWSRYMDIVAYYPAGVGTFQDLVVLQKL